jgi:hypothetical protein
VETKKYTSTLQQQQISQYLENTIMKGLKKIALVTAVAAAPFAAHAEMQAMDDTAMGTVTGQAGVSIELETQVDIGSVIYQDEGQLAISGVSLGGRDTSDTTGAAGTLDNLLIEIDVEADGDAVIHVGTTEFTTDPNGNPRPVPIDFGVSIDSVSLNATDGSNDSTLLASNIGIEGDIAQLDIRVDTATDNLLVDTAFNITDMEMTLDFLGVSIEDMSLTGADTFGATYADSGRDPSGNPYAGLFATASVTVAAVSGVNSNNGEGLSVTIDDFIADVSIGATNIGGASIGTIAMDNLAVTNTKMVVYGRD